jgi:hypothetical protein
MTHSYWYWRGELKWWLRNRRSDLFGIKIWTIDRLPWFARKRLFNWVLGLDWTDFHIIDQILSRRREEVGLSCACIKW